MINYEIRVHSPAWANLKDNTKNFSFRQNLNMRFFPNYASKLFNYHILFRIVHTFSIESDAEILHVCNTWRVAFTNLFHKQSIQ